MAEKKFVLPVMKNFPIIIASVQIVAIRYPSPVIDVTLFFIIFFFHGSYGFCNHNGHFAVIFTGKWGKEIKETIIYSGRYRKLQDSEVLSGNF